VDLPPLYLTEMSPERREPHVGQRVQWPGDDRVWVWNGEEWVGDRTEFDGGDLWEQEEGREAA
jgi:hypothetical protein